MNAYQYLIIIFVISSLAVGSVSDIRKRTVKSYLFIPLVIGSLTLDYYLSAPSLIIGVLALVFFMTFLRTDILPYIVSGVLIFILSIGIFIFIGSFYGFSVLFSAIIFILGYKEKMFGIGDIKAILATIIAMVPMGISSSGLYSYLNTIIPLPFLLFMNIGIFSILVFPYVMITNFRIFGHPYILFAPFKEGLDEIRFAKRKINGKEYSAYRVPFMIPIFISLIATYLSYFMGIIF
ncbi:MAG: hypothetical protein ACYDAO_00175 [Thermoplasmataceae archaeon]